MEFVAFLIVTGIALSYVFDGEAEQGLDRLKDLSAYCVVLAGWFAVFWGLVVQQVLVHASRSWPSVEGRILRSGVGTQHIRGDSSGGALRVYGAFVEYEYVVEEQLYSCTKIFLGGQLNTSFMGRAKIQVDRYPAGKQVKVYFYRRYPAFACLERTAPASWFLTVTGLGFGVFGYFFLG